MKRQSVVHGLVTFGAGFGVTNAFYLAAIPTTARGLYTYWSATLGDAIALPILVGSLTEASIELGSPGPGSCPSRTLPDPDLRATIRKGHQHHDNNNRRPRHEKCHRYWCRHAQGHPSRSDSDGAMVVRIEHTRAARANGRPEHPDTLQARKYPANARHRFPPRF